MLSLFIRKANGQCWKDAYGREGHTLTSCNDNEEKGNSGSWCYPKCKANYFGNGPFCYEQCQQGYSNTGLTCFRAGGDSYLKGCCCINFGFWENGCCGCRKDYTDMGCTCMDWGDSYKSDSYSRGIGHPPFCASDEEFQYLPVPLCYKNCVPGYYGTGPICWLNVCDGFYTYNCQLHAICVALNGIFPVWGVVLMGICETRGFMCVENEQACININIVCK